MTRAKLIEEHGGHWGIWAKSYGESGDERPCEDCGALGITRAPEDKEEVVCGDCAAWRLGFAEGKRQALRIQQANKQWPAPTPTQEQGPGNTEPLEMDSDVSPLRHTDVAEYHREDRHPTVELPTVAVEDAGDIS